MTSIAAAHVLTPGGWVGPATVHMDGGVFTRIVRDGDGSGRILVPGFVDLQVNGIDDIDVAYAAGADWDRLAQLSAAQGTTSWLPTLVTMPLEHYDAPLVRIGHAMANNRPGRPGIIGAHLEGPFLGGAPGAHRKDLIQPIDLDWIRGLPSQISLVTLAAEQPEAIAAIRLLRERDVLVAIGHSTATEEQFDAAVKAGAELTTHLFNGMSGVHHREPGVAAFALTNDAVSASLIADGIHVHPRVLKLAFAAMGNRRPVLVTDSVGWRSGSVGDTGVEMRDGAPRLPDGTLAGSTLTMDAAIRTCVAAGVSLSDAVLAASTNPARLLRLGDRGVIAPGMRADLVALTPDLQIEGVWVQGKPAR